MAKVATMTTTRDEILKRLRADAEREAYLETAREDDEICRRIERGRRALLMEGRSETAAA